MKNLINKLLGRTASCIRTDDALIQELQSGNPIYLDVRTEAEYSANHVNGAINIPVQVLSSRIQEVKDMKRPIVTYCRSGKRSELAATLLKAHKIECYNGGGYLDLEELIKTSKVEITT